MLPPHVACFCRGICVDISADMLFGNVDGGEHVCVCFEEGCEFQRDTVLRFVYAQNVIYDCLGVGLDVLNWYILAVAFNS